MAFLRQMKDMAMSDDEILDHYSSEPEPPEYSPNLAFMLSRADLAKICDGDCAPGMVMRFAAMGEAMSVEHATDSCRIEVEMSQMAGEDGKFVEMVQPPTICLCGPELEKLDLEEECEKGDLIHIIGTARVERTSSPRFGEDMVFLTLIEAAIEDESEANRDG